MAFFGNTANTGDFDSTECIHAFETIQEQIAEASETYGTSAKKMRAGILAGAKLYIKEAEKIKAKK